MGDLLMITLHGLQNFNPKYFPGLAAWYDATNPSNNPTSMPTENSPATPLIDLSGNGNIASGIGTPNPLYKYNIQNNRPGILFDGSNAYYEIADASILELTGALEIFVVSKSTDKTAVILNKRSGGSMAYQFATIVNGALPNRGLQYSSAFGTVYSDTTLTASTTHIYTLSCNASTTKMYQNETEIFSFSGDLRPTAVPGSKLTIGSDQGTGLYFNGHMFEIIIYRQQLTDAQRSYIWKQYLNPKWAIY
jgi:hypothetical protein